MDLSTKRGEKSLIDTKAIKPLIERTDREKVRIATAFLEKRGYVVLEKHIDTPTIADIMGCSTTHVLALAKQDATFPRGFDVAIRMRDKEPGSKYRRFSALDVKQWLESRKEDV